MILPAVKMLQLAKAVVTMKQDLTLSRAPIRIFYLNIKIHHEQKLF